MKTSQYIEIGSFVHKLVAFAKAAWALSYAVKSKADLLILDIQLLDYRGTKLAKQLRSISEYRFTRIDIGISAFMETHGNAPATLGLKDFYLACIIY